MVWIQIRTDILSVLIWVLTVCYGYQQTTKFASSKERDNRQYHCIPKQGQIQDFLIGGSNLQRGGGGGGSDLLILPDYLLIFPDFSKNAP